MVFCTYCGREFGRAEHLQRHILTHTKVRPFSCEICHISFSRKDAAQKHHRTHRRQPTTSSGFGSPRRASGLTDGGSLVVACQNCTRTKTKCDRQFPCDRCRIKGLRCEPKVSQSSTDHSLPRSIETLDMPGLSFAGHVDYDFSETDRQDREPAALSLTQDTRHPENQEGETMYSEHQADNGWTDAMDLEPTAPHLGDRQSQSRQNPSMDGRQLHPLFESAPLEYPMLEHPIQDVFTSQGNPAYLVNAGLENPTALTSKSAIAEAPSPANPPGTELLEYADDLSQPFAQLDWNWDRLFASQAATPNIPMLSPNSVADRSPAPSIWAPMASIPGRSVENLARLGDNFADSAPWSQVLPAWRLQHFCDQEKFANVCLSETTRERLLAIAQGFFRLALDSLNVSFNPGSRHLVADIKKYSSSSILLLPPTPILHLYLETFLSSFEPFYPLVSARSLDPNIIAADSHEQVAVVLILLMVSYGAMRDPAVKARRLAIGLLETCRLTLLHLLDKDNINPRSAITTHCALLCTYQAAFSGDKWLMDSSPGLTHQYLIMSIHSRIFEKQSSLPSRLPSTDSIEESWRVWTEREYTSRLAYSWVMVDQEISIFSDSNPTLTLTSLQRELPDRDDLWLATDAASWSAVWKETRGQNVDVSIDTTQPSLPQLFRSLLGGRLSISDGKLQILHLRLLLYPIHILIGQLNELVLCLPDKPRPTLTQSGCHTSASLRLGEMKGLLQSWHEAFSQVHPTTTRERSLKQVTEALYHLLKLNLAISFTHLERYAQQLQTQSDDLRELIEVGVRHCPEAVFHCGHILRITGEMEINLRPLWWPAAVYRVSIVLWTLGASNSLDKSHSVTHYQGRAAVDLAIDKLQPSDPLWQPYLKYSEGKPCLTSEDGRLVPLQESSTILGACVGMLRQHQDYSNLVVPLLAKLEALSNP